MKENKNWKIRWEPTISMALAQFISVPDEEKEEELDYFLKEVLVRTSTHEITERFK